MPRLMEPDSDPDPAIFVIDLKEANKKRIKKKIFCLLLFEGRLHHFSKVKSPKEVTNQGFSYYFCLMIEGSQDSERDPDPYL
jgi:hypothetical protein